MGLVKAGGPPREPPETLHDPAGALADDDAAIRRRAARLLGERREGAPLLCARLDVESDPAVREALAGALLRQPSPAVARHLVGLLSSEEAGPRNQAIELLAAMPDEVAPLIRAILADPDSDVRIFGVNVLGGLPHPQVPAWLVEVIESEPHVNVCAAAVDVLAEIGTPEALPALDRLAARFADEEFLRFSIDLARGRIGVD
ncbi:MAG: HEAT repeat domain-containing protein [Alphaproteobacteria bacterium]|nr:HEAT repeat domain-containing protein [Alphaproteobacteria bacterium]